MQCSKCGYMMDAFEKECPRCARTGSPNPGPATTVNIPSHPKSASSPKFASRSSAAQMVGLFFLVFLILFVLAVALSHLSTTKKPAIFDVPSLAGLDADAIKSKLGQPDSQNEYPEQTAQGINDEGDMTYFKGRYELMITYKINTRQVVDFFIADPSGATYDTDKLANLCNALPEGSSNYGIEPVPCLGKTDEFTGIKIVPK